MMFLLLAGAANQAWAIKAYYHILTLPINTTEGYNTYHLNDDFNTYRLEAVRIMVDNATIVELPAAYKSPLAKNFKYYYDDGINVTKAAAVAMYNFSEKNKSLRYAIAGAAVETEEKTLITSTKDVHIYVTYEYDDSKGLKLDGTENYNIPMSGGFLALNRGRNNRLAIFSEDLGIVSAEDLVSEDFVKYEYKNDKIPGTNISTYWSGNQNTRDEVAGQFHFLFKFEGSDPYNILIGTAYNNDDTYIESHNSEPMVYKWYKGSYLFRPSDDGNFFMASDDHKKYTTPANKTSGQYPKPNPTDISYDATKTGYFHNKGGSFIYNTFALLNNTDGSGYVFMVSRFINDKGDLSNPSDYNNATYNFLIRDDNYNNLTYASKTLAQAAASYSTDKIIYPIRDVYFKIVTPFGNTITASRELSEYTIEHDDIDVEFIPSELNRKYINYTGRFYKDAALENEITSYLDAYDEETGKYNVYVGYETSKTSPIKFIEPSDSYTTATWYELTDFESDQASGKKLKWDATNTVFKNNGGDGVYDKLSEFAFIGDPYELRVIYRDATKTAGANRYVGAASVSDGTTLGFSDTVGDGYKWDIPFGENIDRFVLRLFGSSASTPMYWKWDATSAGNNVTLDDDAEPTRIKVMELPKRNFTYNIVDKAGNIAIKATVNQTIFSPLNGFASIPGVIRSPFLSDETVTYYSEYSGGGRENLDSDDIIDEVPNADADIYVKYTTTHLNNKNIKLNADDPNQQFNVKLNQSYIYYDGRGISSKVSPTDEELASDAYLWCLRNRDPYSMLIDNKAARTSSNTETVTIYDDDGGTTTASKAIGGWVSVADGTWGDDKALVFTSTRAEASHFIAMMSLNQGIYEVMAATGDDAYYHIGRITETKIYSVNTTGYAHGENALRFELAGKEAIIYHLIDKAGNDLFGNEIISNNPRLTLPADYVSPLVAEYYYYPTSAKAATNLEEDRISEIADDTNESDQGGENKDNHVYVTYTVNHLVKFNDDNSPYMLRFYNGSRYQMEDGNDKLTSETFKAVYPYTNGDGNLNIYDSDKNEEQMKGGSSTRSRWTWYFDSDNDDPYHVRIHSKNKIEYKKTGVEHPTYLQTRAVRFNQDAPNVTQKHIVTGGGLPGIASTRPTEYMILGTEGHYKLKTTDKIDDGVTNERREVRSFEQYWKTYNMIKLYILGIPKSTDKFSNDESTWVVPNTPISTTYDENSPYKKYNDTHDPDLNYRDFLYQQMGWHSYDEIVYAVRWNGYNDKATEPVKKVAERLEHWYQTFDMGDGTFDIESAEIPPVLILLDRHGWEIMRKPLPKYESYPYGDELTALKVYDSPMVKEYKFYNNAEKSTGCHKYYLRMQDGAERDQIKVNGKHFTSNSLATLPPRTASGVISGEAVNDLYVTYTVKEEFEKSYTYNFTDNGDGTYTESGTPSKFMILQNGRFARYNGEDNSYMSKPIGEASDPIGGNIFEAMLSPNRVSEANVSTDVDTNSDGVIDDINMWYIQPNLHIDKEMGIKWGASNKLTDREPLTEYATKKKYKDLTGFDPYNIQLQNVGNSKYMTSHMTKTTLDAGVMVGDYTGGGNNSITSAPWVNVKDADTTIPNASEGYDHTYIQITNQTFMAVSDANGNMQLMPRFDHTRRMNTNASSHNTTLEEPVDHDKASADDNSSMGLQTTFFVRPQIFIYQIIDNDGNESLRYKTAGEYFPSIPDHFKSPLAKDFTYYTGFAESTTSNSDAATWNAATGIFRKSITDGSMLANLTNLLPEQGTYIYRIGTRGVFSYKSVNVTKGLLDKQITSTFAGAGHNNDICYVKVRYNYDEETDQSSDGILEGKWFTAKLANKDLKSSETRIIVKDDPATGAVEVPGTNVNLLQGESKPATIDEDDKVWQWKFLQAPADPSSDYYEAPDPYAIHIFNRYANYTTNPSEQPSPMAVAIKVPNEASGTDRFALLSHPDGGYALAVTGLGTADNYDYTYKFLNGDGMTISVGATTATEKNYQLVVATSAAYETARTALSDQPDGDYYFKINNENKYKKVTVTSGTPDEGAESTKEAWEKAYHFSIISGSLSAGSQLQVSDDVTHNFVYKVINNGSKLAISGTQSGEEAENHQYAPYVPGNLQTPLLNMEDYLYYGFATPDDKNNDDPSDDTYTVIPQTILYTINGLYDDVVWVRYNPYDVDNTPYMVPNKRNATGGSTIAVADDAKFTALNIHGDLPYNIIWEGDKMMSTDGATISSAGSKDLSGETNHVWRLFGDDPYAIQIRHGKAGKYDVGSSTLSETADKTFMLLKRDGYDYGVLQVTGDNDGNKLTDYGESLTTDNNPKYFIIFGLSTHKLIYRLVIAKTCPDKDNPKPDEYVDIPYAEIENDVRVKKPDLRIYGTTQRDLTNDNYQLGQTILGQNYCVDAGEVSIGDVLEVPTDFYRPNCNFFFYIDNIQTGGLDYNQKEATDATDYATKKADLAGRTDGYYYFKIGTSTYTYKRVQVKDGAVLSGDVDCSEDDWNNIWQDDAGLNGNYKGLKVDKLMEDQDLIGSVVKVNIAYAFQTGLETNAGEGFVTSTDQNLWYTFETKDVATPYLAHYTNAWGLQSMKGRETRYTNDYLWSPLGDVYGFRMYNRYMIKNSGGVNNVMTTDDISEGQNLKMAVSTSGKEVYELLGSNNPGYFRIHPVINYTGTQYYVWKDPSDNYTKLSTNYSEWTFNLPLDLLKPYIERVGYVGGLTKDAYTTNKTVLDKVMNGTATYEELLTVQGIVYDDDNIVSYQPGYYRMHNQPEVSDIDPVRYASGYLHKTELTGDGSHTNGPIPMHFYSKSGVTGTFDGDTNPLESGFTLTNATRGAIPVPATEKDPSTIFYFAGAALTDEQIADHQVPTSKISTQGLYVAANPNGDSNNGTTTNRLQRAVMSDANAITFSLMDIGGAVLLIHDGAVPAERRYLNFDQSNFFQRTADNETDMNDQAAKLTSKGTYYFRIGENLYTYKKLTVTSGYVAPSTSALHSEAESSNESEWNAAADNYDLKFYHDSPTDDAKWCLQPVQKDNTAGTNEMALTINTNNGGDDYYYATFCAPFDVLLPSNNTKIYDAYTSSVWNDAGLNMDKVPASESYTAGKFVPAGTPVVIRTTDESGSMKLILPSSGPTTITEENPLEKNIFTGKYLEQMLNPDASHDVYTLGLPFTTPVTIDRATGAVTAELSDKANKGVGFYINANQNKENDAIESLWLRNNNYVLYNKIYYRATEDPGASARGMTRSAVEFVPLIFDDLYEDNHNGGNGDMMPSQTPVGDGCVYDMQGRRVANAEQVLDGTWKQRVAPGIYIINGKKLLVE